MMIGPGNGIFFSHLTYSEPRKSFQFEHSYTYHLWKFLCFIIFLPVLHFCPYETPIFPVRFLSYILRLYVFFFILG